MSNRRPSRRCVWVEWVDSASFRGWGEGTAGVAEIKTLGFVIDETDDNITISAHVDEDNGNAHGAMTIPKVAITGMWEVTF